MDNTEDRSGLFSLDNARRLSAVLIAIVVLLLGVLYYGFYRQAVLPEVLSWLPELTSLEMSWPLPSFIAQSVPSLTHAFATVLLLHVLLPEAWRQRIAFRGLIVLFLVGLELLFGTADGADIMAILLGTASAERVAWRLGLIRYARLSFGRWPLFGLVFLSGLSAMASYYVGEGFGECAVYDENGVCEEYKKPASPVYMSYQQLRNSVSFQPARPPDQLGRMYLYQDYVFLNERNQGIHVIDNRVPETPINLGFIRIPGNTEVAIRDNYLYADSYIDLITLDLNDPANIQLIARQEGIFPYDAFQNIPYNISFNLYADHAQNGVVVGYRLTGE